MRILGTAIFASAIGKLTSMRDMTELLVLSAKNKDIKSPFFSNFFLDIAIFKNKCLKFELCKLIITVVKREDF